MKAIIAEKPSVAREIAQLLNANERKDGYLEGNGYCVTWAFGHLVSLGMPEDYGVRGFDKASLPIFPEPFVLLPRSIKKQNQKGSHPDPSALKQLKIIQNVINKCSSIIVATDAGREGELIFRYIYQYLHCNKPFERLWISSLTEKAIQEGFKKLQPGSIFDGLYQAAKARSEADWLVGINATQALSIAANQDVYSLGRVQTPTLALICKRYEDHNHFTKKKYWQIQLKHRKEYLDFTSQSTQQWDDKKQIEPILKSIEREGKAIVEDVSVKTVQETSPLLFDLTELQKEANRKLGLSADEVLKTAQALYEKRFISYPRTGSKHIPEDLWTEIPELVRMLNTTDQFKPAISTLKFGNFNKRMVNDLKVTDHHGLLITTKIPSALTATEKAIYDKIAYRLLESLSEHCSKQVSHITVKVHHYEFSIKGSKILTQGWRAIKGILSDSDGTDTNDGTINSNKNNVDETLINLPELKIGDELKISQVNLQEKTTQPPKLYSEADLLSAMENAGSLIEDKEAQKAISSIGIGTPASRASIIENLLSRNYITRKSKTLVPTEKGLKVYHLVKDQKIANVQMTAEWEMALEKIEKGELSSKQFITDIKDYAKEITKELLSLSIVQENIPELKCPKCRQQNLVIRDKIIKCPDEQCNWLQFRNVCGVKLSTQQITSLINNGKTPLIKNMKAKNGKKFSAYIVIRNDDKTMFEFPDH
ncbi:DNA topoisomerase [Chryseobacterium sp. Ch-15]|uniref:DNA topoisomerase n=1 Tax=Chryseobacterium muglaense TaxID=2893752 RepID=A0A9Q3UW66_9FLAO|nr:type IA DNA topoisomerase [Chryseobacterium muglaense]MBD3906435.1 topoisomerase C-terminal repeat-containing protein [Chryseobacterium muglaense]MCC9036853.1 DNA topoisomerase [Chryseobacterium muglaense]MCM2556179.1 DNA topoisomerase [Chryseobacterium muglaense]